MFGTEIKVEYTFFLMLAFSVFVSNYSLIYVLVFSALHELGHIAALTVLGERAELITVAYYGIGLKYNSHTGPLKSIVIILCGPAVNLIFMLLGIEIEINTALFVINLLPIYPLDGGRILLGLMTMLLGARTGERIAYRISIAITVLLLIAGTVLAFNNGSKAPAAAALWLMLAQRNGGAELFKEKEC